MIATPIPPLYRVSEDEQKMLEQITDKEVISAMIEYGGSFVSSLGLAATNADPVNLNRIKHAWPTYWDSYANMAARHKCQALKSVNQANK